MLKNIPDDLMSRAKKILALAEHPRTPEHEKNTAWQTLFRMMDRHNFTILDMRGYSPDEEISEQCVHSCGRLPQHTRFLFIALSEVFQCRTIVQRISSTHGVSNVLIVGHNSNIQLVEFFSKTLPKAIKKAWDSLYELNVNEGMASSQYAKRTLYPSFFWVF